jgi:hypothetical protein
MFNQGGHLEKQMSFSAEGNQLVRLFCALRVPRTIALPFGGSTQTTELIAYSIERQGDKFVRF